MEISRVEPDSDLSLALRAPGTMSSMPSTSQPESESAPVSLLGYPLCFKRPRSSSSSSCSSPSKRLEREPKPDTESRRAAVRAWGNLPLSLADPDVFEIMEKEKHRQVMKILVILLVIFICFYTLYWCEDEAMLFDKKNLGITQNNCTLREVCCHIIFTKTWNRT